MGWESTGALLRGPAGPSGPAGADGADGAAGPAGPVGNTGAAGPGLATGGTLGQVPTKTSAANYATGWTSVPIDRFNNASGGVQGVTFTTENTGGASGDAFTYVSTATNGTTIFDAAGGRAAYKLAGGGVDGGSNFAYLRWPIQSNRVYTSFRFRTDSVNSMYYAVAWFSTGSLLFGPNASKLCIRNGANSAILATGTHTLTNNTWYILDVYVEAGVGSTVRLRDDAGVLLDTVTYSGTVLAATETGLNFGYGFVRGSVSQWVTDIFMSTSGRLSTWRSTSEPGPVGPQGPQGPEGPQGPAGETAAGGIDTLALMGVY